MKACVCVLLAAFASGCGGGSPVGYDPVHDESRISTEMGDVSISGRADVRGRLSFTLSGRGKHPADWSCTLFAMATEPIDSPASLGDAPELIISPGVGEFRAKGWCSRDESEALKSVTETAGFGVPMENLIQLSEGRRLKLNGRDIPLDDPQRALIRDAVVAARGATNAGK